MATKKKASKSASRPSDAQMVDTIAGVGTEREKIAEIETHIARADKKRKENGEIEERLDTELTSMEAKLNEVLHEHYDELTPEEDAKGNKLRVYQRGDFRAAIASKDSLQYEVKKARSANQEGNGMALCDRDRQTLAAAFPPNGPCMFHPTLYARHRVVDVIRGQHAGGEGVRSLARNFEKSERAIRIIVSSSLNELAFLRRYRGAVCRKCWPFHDAKKGCAA